MYSDYLRYTGNGVTTATALTNSTHFEKIDSYGNHVTFRCKANGTYTFTYISSYAGTIVYPEQ